MKYEETVQAVNTVMAEYAMPLTLRQIYYRLVVAGLIPNRRAAYNSLSSQLVKAREEGEVDENRIVDRSRRIDDFAFESPEGFLATVKYTLEQNYVRRFWASQETYVEVWVEKDALSGVMANAVKPLNTIIAPSRGYSSYSYLKSAADRFMQYCDGGKDGIVLHFADHDPSGLDMSRDLADRLNRYCGLVEVKRIALSHDQVKKYNLIPNPTKLADPRSPEYIYRYGNECWELDAIEPDELVSLCHEAVFDQINDTEAWYELAEQDKQERALLMKRLNELEEEL